MAPQDAARTRTYSWQDPLASARAGRVLPGLEFLRKIAAGELAAPPIAHTLDYTLLEVEEGRAVFGLQPAEIHYNPIGMVHGGIPCTLLDSAMGCAVHSTLPAGAGYTTLEIKTNIVRAISRDTGFLRAEGRLIHAGRSTAVAEGRLSDESGKLYAHATTTCLILRP
ncbi:MAG: PaaI family thioesterase [Nevskiaceae bacterium]